MTATYEVARGRRSNADLAYLPDCNFSVVMCNESRAMSQCGYIPENFDFSYPSNRITAYRQTMNRQQPYSAEVLEKSEL